MARTDGFDEVDEPEFVDGRDHDGMSRVFFLSSRRYEGLPSPLDTFGRCIVMMYDILRDQRCLALPARD